MTQYIIFSLTNQKTLTMKQNTIKIKNYLQQTYTNTQTQIIEFTNKTQNSLKKTQSSLKNGPTHNKEH